MGPYDHELGHQWWFKWLWSSQFNRNCGLTSGIVFDSVSVHIVIMAFYHPRLVLHFPHILRGVDPRTVKMSINYLHLFWVHRKPRFSEPKHGLYWLLHILWSCSQTWTIDFWTSHKSAPKTELLVESWTSHGSAADILFSYFTSVFFSFHQTKGALDI